MISRGPCARLAVFLVYGFLSPGLAWASRTSLADLNTSSLEALADLPSGFETVTREERKREACGPFCGNPLRLELTPPTLSGRGGDPWRVFSPHPEGERFDVFGARGPFWIVEYANDNPTRYTDPTGHQAVPDDVYYQEEWLKSLPPERAEKIREEQTYSVSDPAAWALGELYALGKSVAQLPLGALEFLTQLDEGKFFKIGSEYVPNRVEAYRKGIDEYAEAKARNDYFRMGEVQTETTLPESGLVLGGAGLLRRLSAPSRAPTGELTGVVHEGRTGPVVEPLGGPLEQSNLGSGLSRPNARQLAVNRRVNERAALAESEGPFVGDSAGRVASGNQLRALARAREATSAQGATSNTIGEAGEEFLAEVANRQGGKATMDAGGARRFVDRRVLDVNFEVKNTARRQSNTRFFREQLRKEQILLQQASPATSRSVLIGTRGFSLAAARQATAAGVEVIDLEDFPDIRDIPWVK